MVTTPLKCLSSFDHCDKKILSEQKIVSRCVQGWGLASDDSQISHAQDWDQDWPPLDWICRPFLPIHKPHLRKRPPKSRSGTVG